MNLCIVICITGVSACRLSRKFLMWYVGVQIKCLSPALRLMRERKTVASTFRLFSTQQSLPRLPVPPLQQTMDKYLRTVRPLVTDNEFAHTQQVNTDGTLHFAFAQNTISNFFLKAFHSFCSENELQNIFQVPVLIACKQALCPLCSCAFLSHGNGCMIDVGVCFDLPCM